MRLSATRSVLPAGLLLLLLWWRYSVNYAVLGGGGGGAGDCDAGAGGGGELLESTFTRLWNCIQLL